MNKKERFPYTDDGYEEARMWLVENGLSMPNERDADSVIQHANNINNQIRKELNELKD